MNKIKIYFLTFIVSFSFLYSRADEGMLLPLLLGRSYDQMKKYGLNLTAEEIYSINNSSIKDAIISFNGYCTGEVISKNGLILTNHHCGYEAIAEASTPEHNYLDNGFWAKNYQEEIKTNLFVTFIIRIEDVTEKVKAVLNDNMSETERAKKAQEIGVVLAKEATNGTNYEAFVRDFYDGNEFYLFVTEKFTDIRFVGTPPQSAGKFGGDTDNWMWPRHTADFSIFRIYAGTDNKPAPYSASNIPYSPKHHLPISIKGVKENDFAMVMGFPGRTDRYLSSWGIEQTVSLEKPKRVELRAIKMDVMKRYMNADVAVRLKYSSNYASTANYWKNFQGEILQVKNNKVIAKKQAIEQQFADYAKQHSEYSNVLSSFASSFKTLESVVNIKAYQSEFVYTVDAAVLAYRYKLYKDAFNAGNTERANMILAFTNNIASEYFVNSSMGIESDIVSEIFKLYVKDIPASQQGELTKKISAKGEKGINKYMATVKSKSIFFNKALFDKFVTAPSIKALDKDPLFKLIEDVANAYDRAMSAPEIQKATDDLKKANRDFTRGLRLMMPNKEFYPNANSTIRLTYGQVLPYSPKDAVYYDYVTSLDGMIQKEDPTNPEFNIDPKIKEVYAKKDWGQYADKERGYVVCNFLSNNDITGGNSGSPVINGDGHLIGTAFDGNWEAMSGNIFFEDKVQRTISCDIRYVLWLIDRVYGAQNLIDEMTLVK
ncbi:MAG: S46 family peptidase [Crocinitomicaceae bacterium]|nr:S46 family peptidase [Crocinitomicaceae bacterium]